MQPYSESIREAAKRLLLEKRVDAVIGFRKGTVPFMNEPFLARTPEQADQLVWDGNCAINLANYLPKRTGSVAIAAKGCDSRSIVIHLLENQIRREQLYVLGIPCQGMTDKRKIADRLNGRQVLQAEENGGKVLVSGRDFEQSFERAEFLQQNCAICTHKNPVLYDELLGQPVEEQQIDRYEQTSKIESMLPEQKRLYFDELVQPCIRCYACRNACPACYCPTCFVDESKPQWLGKTTDPTDTLTFHFLRAFHVAGRCTDCGSCERACPVGIKVRLFTMELEKQVKKLYGYEAGMTQDERPPLDAFRSDDPEPFLG
jgi:ferredoxin